MIVGMKTTEYTAALDALRTAAQSDPPTRKAAAAAMAKKLAAATAPLNGWVNDLVAVLENLEQSGAAFAAADADDRDSAHDDFITQSKDLLDLLEIVAPAEAPQRD